MADRRRALISVYNKDGILDLAAFLASGGWEIISTGGTAKYLRENKIDVTDVSAITGFPECLDGRVKTLHPAIHAGLLARRDDSAHMSTLASLGLAPVDMVCVNLYPFFDKVKEDLSEADTIEFIDIGGPSMLRSAAKNFAGVIALTDPHDYPAVTAALQAGEVPANLKRRLAAKVFALTSAYDAAIARYLAREENAFGEYLPLSLKKAQELRYGENAHQNAALYLNADSPGALGGMTQLHGKELGYNNIRDLDLAWKAASSFSPEICCAAVKHNTPCGLALGSSALEAFGKAYACDSVSIFGGIVAFNIKVDAAVAAKLHVLFLEIVVAPDFDEEALAVLKKKKNLRIMKATAAPREKYEYIAVDGGLLVQEADRVPYEKWEVVTKAAPPDEDLADMRFGMRAVAWVKSNAIVVAKNLAAVGSGGGQTNRIDAAAQAIARGKTALATGVFGEGPARVLASDAFFPFDDVVKLAAENGIRSIVQPGGSLRDADSIAACDAAGIAMVFTGTRHFKH